MENNQLNNKPIQKNVTTDEVLNELKALDPSASKGSVSIEAKLFKECANELAS